MNRKYCLKKIIFLAVCIILFANNFLSCGLEDYYYIEQVSQARIKVELNSKATISLPSLTSIYSRNYTIYYRIYISGQQESGEIQTSSAVLQRINSALSSDYNSFYPSTDPTNTTASTNMGTLFKNRHYYELQLYGGNFQGLTGGEVVIDFSATGEIPPSLTIAGTGAYILLRSDGEGDFAPVPDRLFFNSSDLNSNANAVNTINADTAANSSWSDGQVPRYTYVSLYLVAVGFDERSFSTIFSKPTHIGILRLPDPH